MRPIIVDEEKVILAGHGLRESLIRDEYDECPALVISGLTDEQKRAYLIADNRLAERSSWNWEVLGEELNELQGVMDLADLGFTEWDPDVAVVRFKAKTGEITEDDLETEHKCPKCGFEY